ncbi:MAG TPA: RCC1 domain-containing protein, partial [Jatrophihabitantaceae bacterium]|nr:RCC1 domain-containing protein [Jatrophihabitantaceae bacterium]
MTIGAGVNIGYAVNADGTTWTWGRNSTGQLGDSTHTDRYTPVQVSGLTNVWAIADGSRLSCAVDTDGHLWRWGGADPVPQRFDSACAVGTSVVANSTGAWERCDDDAVWQLDH